MSSPDITQRELQAVHEVLETGRLSLGPCLSQFETEFAQLLNLKHAIGVSSGTSGLHICVIAAGCRPGDAVVTTPFSFVASANVILYENGIPVFVDVEETSGNIDPTLAVKAIQSVKAEGLDSEYLPRLVKQNAKKCTGRLAAVLPVHAFGQPVDIARIVEAARSARVPIIEDACEAIGARYQGQMVGAIGNASVFAFYPNKQMTTGEGGLIVTDDDAWDQLARSLRNQGRDVFDSWLNHSRLGYNYRMDELSAALGLIQLRRLDELLRKREQVARWFGERLVDVPGVLLPKIEATTTQMSWFVYVIRLDSAQQRTAVMEELTERGIPTRPYFAPIHLIPFYAERFGYRRGDYPVAERLGDTSLALPFSGVMTEAQVNHVCAHLAEVMKQIPDRPI